MDRVKEKRSAYNPKTASLSITFTEDEMAEIEKARKLDYSHDCMPFAMWARWRILMLVQQEIENAE